MSDARHVLGAVGEQAALGILGQRGMRLVEQNARTRYGEIDLVLRDRSGYVFVEVKTRRSTSFVAAAEAVDRRKVRRLAGLAEAWLAHRGERESAWRLVVVALTVNAAGVRAEVIDID